MSRFYLFRGLFKYFLIGIFMEFLWNFRNFSNNLKQLLEEKFLFFKESKMTNFFFKVFLKIFFFQKKKWFERLSYSPAIFLSGSILQNFSKFFKLKKKTKFSKKNVKKSRTLKKKKKKFGKPFSKKKIFFRKLSKKGFLFMKYLLNVKNYQKFFRKSYLFLIVKSYTILNKYCKRKIQKKRIKKKVFSFFLKKNHRLNGTTYFRGFWKSSKSFNPFLVLEREGFLLREIFWKFDEDSDFIEKEKKKTNQKVLVISYKGKECEIFEYYQEIQILIFQRKKNKNLEKNLHKKKKKSSNYFNFPGTIQKINSFDADFFYKKSSCFSKTFFNLTKKFIIIPSEVFRKLKKEKTKQLFKKFIDLNRFLEFFSPHLREKMEFFKFNSTQPLLLFENLVVINLLKNFSENTEKTIEEILFLISKNLTPLFYLNKNFFFFLRFEKIFHFSNIIGQVVLRIFFKKKNFSKKEKIYFPFFNSSSKILNRKNFFSVLKI